MKKIPYQKWSYRLWSSFCSHWRSKILAMLLALIVWFYMRTVMTEQRVCEIALQVESPSSGNMVILSVPTATLVLEGPTDTLRPLASKPILGKYTLATIALGNEEVAKEYTVSTMQFVSLPKELKIVSGPSPATIRITVVACETRLLAIQPVVYYETSSTYQVSAINSKPSFILAKAPKPVAEKGITYTETIQLGKISKPGDFDIATRLVPKIEGWPVEYVSYGDDIRVHFYIQENLEQWISFRVRLITDFEVELPALISATPLPLQVQISGPRRIVEKYTQVVAYILLPDKLESMQVLPLNFMLPETIKIISASPIPLPTHLRIEKKN